MRPLTAVPRAIRIIVPTALIAGVFGFVLGHQSDLGQAPSRLPQASSSSSAGQVASPSPNPAGWVQTFTCGSAGGLCATLATNGYRILDADTGSIVGIGTIQRVYRRSATVQFPSAPAGRWQIEVSPPGYCGGCGNPVSPRDWGPFKPGQSVPVSLAIGAH